MRIDNKVLSGLISLLSVTALCSTAQAQDAQGWRDSNHVYQNICAHCHETGIGPALRERNLPVEYIRYTVRHGRLAMPAFRDSDIDDALLRQLAQQISSSTVAYQRKGGQ